MESLGIPWHFGERIDGSFNRTTRPDSKWPANNEWTWQLNRHADWRALSETLCNIGDERYAAELAARIRGRVRDCPMPMDKPDNAAGSRWRTTEADIRTGSGWPAIRPRIPASRRPMTTRCWSGSPSWVEHARRLASLAKFKTSGNRLTMKANGLYHVGALLTEFREATFWQGAALARRSAELDIQVYPDDTQVELAPSCHAVSLWNFPGPVRLAERVGVAPPPCLPRENGTRVRRRDRLDAADPPAPGGDRRPQGPSHRHSAPARSRALDIQGQPLATWPVEWRLRDLQSEEPARRFAFVAPSPLPAGVATIAMRVPNPMPGGRPLRFANRSQDREPAGWMALGPAPIDAAPRAGRPRP